MSDPSVGGSHKVRGLYHRRGSISASDSGKSAVRVGVVPVQHSVAESLM